MTKLRYIAVFFVLISPAQGQEDRVSCIFKTEIGHGVGIDSVERPISNISDSTACKAACCDRKDCDLAMVEFVQDGSVDCYLVSCMKDGKNVCPTRKRLGFDVHLKKHTTPEAEDRTAVSNVTDVCSLPAVVGVCRGYFPRFYYNTTLASCQNFIYGGCGGNGNNFETLAACDASCNATLGAVTSNQAPVALEARRLASADNSDGSSEITQRDLKANEFVEYCQAEAMTGPCRASMPRYFYNTTASACQSFIYGGCRGNKNNYASAEDCQAKCSATVTPSPRKAPRVNSTDRKSTGALSAPCLEKQEVGPCRAAFPMFYFDSASQSCLPFIYGGCKGNGNRFNTVEECMAQCSGEQGNMEMHEHRSDRTPAYIMVGTLAVSSVVALVGLVLVILRKAKFPRRRRRDDKEELLPEDQLATEQRT